MSSCFDEAMEHGDASAATIAISDGFLETWPRSARPTSRRPRWSATATRGATSPCIGAIPGTDFNRRARGHSPSSRIPDRLVVPAPLRAVHALEERRAFALRHCRHGPADERVHQDAEQQAQPDEPAQIAPGIRAARRRWPRRKVARAIPATPGPLRYPPPPHDVTRCIKDGFRPQFSGWPTTAPIAAPLILGEVPGIGCSAEAPPLTTKRNTRDRGSDPLSPALPTCYRSAQGRDPEAGRPRGRA